MSLTKNKMVAVLNEKVEIGKVMNALAHMCIGFGSKIGSEQLNLQNYIDADGNSHPNISEMPFIILKGNSSQIRKTRQMAEQAQVAYTNFTETMTQGTSEEQIQRHSQTPEAELTYFGIVLFGEWDKVTEITRKFSLWR